MTPVPHLLIGDDDDILSLLRNFFEKHSHTVTVAADGVTMFAALETHSIDLVILDVMLASEYGCRLCQRLRAISRVPIIMLRMPVSDCGRGFPVTRRSGVTRLCQASRWPVRDRC